MKGTNLNKITLTCAVLGLVYPATAISDATEETRLNLQKNMTVSGVSSGGYMANQFHIAHSDSVTGAGIISAGPYFCSQGNLMTAMGQCLANGTALESTGTENKNLTAAITSNAKNKLIAPLPNLKNDKVWMLHGTMDKRVGRKVNDALYAQYQAFTNANYIKFVTDKAFNHHLPTMSFGVDCAETASPFIGNCDYDAAGKMLSWIVDTSANPTSKSVSQGSFYTLPQPTKVDGKETGLAQKAWLYVPEACASGSACQLHISFHGCQQNTASIGNDYVENGGFNPWADKLNLAVLYPQIASDNALNPLACWDWWGYSGSDFHTQSGPQIKAIKQVTEGLISGVTRLTRQSNPLPQNNNKASKQ